VEQGKKHRHPSGDDSGMTVYEQQKRMIQTILRINQIPVPAVQILGEVHSEQNSEASFPDTTQRLASLFQAYPATCLTDTLWKVRLRILWHLFHDSEI